MRYDATMITTREKRRLLEEHFLTPATRPTDSIAITGENDGAITIRP